MDELKSYIVCRLMWDPDIDVDAHIRRFCRCVYGDAAGQKIEEYVFAMMDACEHGELRYKQDADVEFITDALIDQSETLFTQALALAESEDR